MKFISHKDTNVLIRKALKEAFPGVKFSVKANGSTTHVSFEGGPLASDVEKVARHFEGASFDGMTDMESPVNHVVKGEQVHYGSKYVFVERDLSNEEELAAVAFMEKNHIKLPGEHESIETPAKLMWMRQELNVRRNVHQFIYYGELIRFVNELLIAAKQQDRAF